MKKITKKQINENIRVQRRGFSEWFYTYQHEDGEFERYNSIADGTKKDFVNYLYIKLN